MAARDRRSHIPAAVLAAGLVVALFACDGGGEGGPDPHDPIPGGDDGSSSAPPVPGTSDVQLTTSVEPSPWVPTSASARWSVTGDEVADTWIEVACEGLDAYTVPAEADAEASFHASLVWLPPASA